jgi:hypothetical protein
MTSSGFKVRRDTVTKREGPIAALPEQSDVSERFGRSSFLQELGADRARYVREIERLWSEAQERFLTIGRYLVRAKDQLPHGAFEVMILNELPFGRHVAWQLRTIAIAVDGGRLVEGELPRSYTTAYKLAKLEDDALARAKKDGLVRVDVTRSEIVAFLRRLADEVNGRRPTLDRLVEEREALKRRLDFLAEEQRGLKLRLAEIDNDLGQKTIEGRAVEGGDTD